MVVVNARRRCWVSTAGEFKCESADASPSANAERKCDWGLAGISVVKREHEGRGAAGWVILFDPVRGLDESTRQRLCSSARLPEVLLSLSSCQLSPCLCPRCPDYKYCSLIVDFQGIPRVCPRPSTRNLGHDIMINAANCMRSCTM